MYERPKSARDPVCESARLSKFVDAVAAETFSANELSKTELMLKP